MWEAIREIGGVILALVLVLLLAWLVLRWLNNRMPGLGGGSTERMIRVLDRVAVGKNVVVLLVRVKDTVMLVAVSDHAIEKLAEFDAADGSFDVKKAAAENPSFAAALKDAVAKTKLPLFGKAADKTEGAAQEDEPAPDGTGTPPDGTAGAAPDMGGTAVEEADTGEGSHED